jgi:hypothetical protein
MVAQSCDATSSRGLEASVIVIATRLVIVQMSSQHHTPAA